MFGKRSQTQEAKCLIDTKVKNNRQSSWDSDDPRPGQCLGRTRGGGGWGEAWVVSRLLVIFTVVFHVMGRKMFTS